MVSVLLAAASWSYQSRALSIIFGVILALGWIGFGIVCWIFWRAKKREDTARLEAANRWPNAPSS